MSQSRVLVVGTVLQDMQVVQVSQAQVVEVPAGIPHLQLVEKAL